MSDQNIQKLSIDALNALENNLSLADTSPCQSYDLSTHPDCELGLLSLREGQLSIHLTVDEFEILGKGHPLFIRNHFLIGCDEIPPVLTREPHGEEKFMILRDIVGSPETISLEDLALKKQLPQHFFIDSPLFEEVLFTTQNLSNQRESFNKREVLSYQVLKLLLTNNKSQTETLLSEKSSFFSQLFDRHTYLVKTPYFNRIKILNNNPSFELALKSRSIFFEKENDHILFCFPILEKPWKIEKVLSEICESYESR